MSQEKVTKYKEAKAKRKDVVKKEKREKILVEGTLALIPILVVGVIVMGIVSTYLDSRPRPSVDVKYKVISEFDDTMMQE